MSTVHSAQLSGSDNPHVEILNEQFLVNADGHKVKRTQPHPCEDAIERFKKKVKISETLFFEGSPCWEWKGCIHPVTGYGQFRFDGRRGSMLSNPHRYAYMYYIGDIPDGYEIDHLCRTRHCCNPSHLEAVTLQENRRRRNETQTHCKNGHEFTPGNTSHKKTGGRVCKACRREVAKAFRRRNPDYEKRMNFPSRKAA